MNIEKIGFFGLFAFLFLVFGASAGVICNTAASQGIVYSAVGESTFNAFGNDANVTITANVTNVTGAGTLSVTLNATWCTVNQSLTGIGNGTTANYTFTANCLQQYSNNTNTTIGVQINHSNVAAGSGSANCSTFFTVGPIVPNFAIAAAPNFQSGNGANTVQQGFISPAQITITTSTVNSSGAQIAAQTPSGDSFALQGFQTATCNSWVPASYTCWSIAAANLSSTYTIAWTPSEAAGTQSITYYFGDTVGNRNTSVTQSYTVNAGGGRFTGNVGSGPVPSAAPSTTSAAPAQPAPQPGAFGLPNLGAVKLPSVQGVGTNVLAIIGAFLLLGAAGYLVLGR